MVGRALLRSCANGYFVDYLRRLVVSFSLTLSLELLSSHFEALRRLSFVAPCFALLACFSNSARKKAGSPDQQLRLAEVCACLSVFTSCLLLSLVLCRLPTLASAARLFKLDAGRIKPRRREGGESLRSRRLCSHPARPQPRLNRLVL